MKISILTIEPERFESFLSSHVITRARELGVLELELVDIRLFAEKRGLRQIDDSPFGGGPGLILRCGPILDALAYARGSVPGPSCAAVLTPRGERYSQALARELAGTGHLILICGHYEGIDERVFPHTDREISIGDYVLTGGELAAQVVADSVARLLPGVLKAGSADDESFESGLLEYPQYTQPADYRGDRVPDVLLSGNHAAIRKWREEQALRITAERRPDLLS